MLRKLLVAGVVVLAGCAAPGELKFTPAVVDFGPALPGVERRQTVVLLNDSAAELELSTTPGPVFWLTAPPRIAAHATAEVVVHYRPAADATGRDQAAMTLNSNLPELNASLVARGTPTRPDCTLPARLDFGLVARGATYRLELPLLNATSETSAVVVGAVEQLTPAAFANDSAPGGYLVGAEDEHLARFSFSPQEAREYAGTVRLSRHPLCGEQAVSLVGTGVFSTFSWTPAALDLGQVPVGSTARMSVFFQNHAFTPVLVTQLTVRSAASGSPPFTVDRTQLAVPPAARLETGELVPGTASVEVSFSPAATGPHAAQLSGSTDVTAQPTLLLPLRGTGAP